MNEWKNEEKKWREIRVKQIKEEDEREEHDRIAKEKFDKESIELAFDKRRRVLMARKWIKRRKQHFIKLRAANINHKRKKHDTKCEADLVEEIMTKDTPDELRKWLYRNLSLALAPKKSIDPEWRKKSILLQEIIASRKDLNKLKKIAEKHKPEWALYFKY